MNGNLLVSWSYYYYYYYFFSALQIHKVRPGLKKRFE